MTITVAIFKICANILKILDYSLGGDFDHAEARIGAKKLVVFAFWSSISLIFNEREFWKSWSKKIGFHRFCSRVVFLFLFLLFLIAALIF